MKLEYGYSIDEIDVNMEIALFKLPRGDHSLPVDIVTDSEEKGVVMATVTRVRKGLIEVRVGWVFEEIHINHNMLANFKRT